MEIIIFGKDSHNTVSSIRCVGEAGFQPIVIVISSHKRVAAKKSKYVKQFFQVSEVEDGVKILQCLANPNERQIIFPTSDLVASALDNHYDDLKSSFVFPNCGSSGALNLYMKKDIMSQKAKECGLNIPQSIPYITGAVIPNALMFPCLCKPLKSITGSKSDISVFNDIITLKEFLTRNRATKEFLLQEFINIDYEIVIIGCMTTSGKIILPAYTIVKRRVFDGDETSFGEVLRGMPSILNKNSLSKYLNELNYHGVFGVEFAVSNNMPYFLEINLRNDGTIYHYTKVGANILKMFILDKDTTDYNMPESIYCIDDLGDIINVIRNKTTFINWFLDIKKSKSYKYFNTKDKKPFYVFAPRMLRVVAATLYRKLTGRL